MICASIHHKTEGMMSKRTPFHDCAGYVTSRKNLLTGIYNVVYLASEQGIDADEKYVTVCEAHRQMVSSASVEKARADMRDSSGWCTDCQSLEGIIFDDFACDLVSQCDWGLSTKGYAKGWIHGKPVYMHRYLWEMFKGSIPPGWQVDHINGKKLDNRLENLRLVTPRRQQWNLKGHRDGTFSSPLVGAIWVPDMKKWISRIKIQGKSYSLGMFDTDVDAHNAYMAKVAELEGERT